MKTKAVLDLVYVGDSKNENGSPIRLEIVKENIKCDLMETFSSYYYSENERLMRLSRNFSVPVELVRDLNINGIRYELSYVIFDGLRYQIRNVLNHRQSIRLKILDCQELR